MQQVEHVPQNSVTARCRIMQLVPWSLVVPVVDELSGVQIQMIGPVSVLTARIEYNELLIVTAPSRSETAKVADSGQ
jgi:hypothetical protein